MRAERSTWLDEERDKIPTCSGARVWQAQGEMSYAVCSAGVLQQGRDMNGRSVCALHRVPTVRRCLDPNRMSTELVWRKWSRRHGSIVSKACLVSGMYLMCRGG
jgi:hypothetical protein